MSGQVAGNVLVCDQCGARYDMTPALPMPMTLAAALFKQWGKDHKKCKGGIDGFRWARTLGEWPMSDDTGKSSKAIYSHMRGAFMDSASHPLDPSDFGRCYRLLALAPEWRRRIAEMDKYGDEWARLAAAWDELTALYEEESPSGKCPRLYARMKELTAPPRAVEAPIQPTPNAEDHAP